MPQSKIEEAGRRLRGVFGTAGDVCELSDWNVTWWPDGSLELEGEPGARASSLGHSQHVGGPGAVRMGTLTWDLGGREEEYRESKSPPTLGLERSRYLQLKSRGTARDRLRRRYQFLRKSKSVI